MKLLTVAQKSQLLTNGLKAARGEPSDPLPVVKLFSPVGAATWLLSESDPSDPDHLFGLCDLGLGYPELGYVSLRELETVKLPLGLRIERDLYWTPSKTISQYAAEAQKLGRISP